MADEPVYFYVVRNTPTVHLTETFGQEGHALCGTQYVAHTAQVVHEQPDLNHFSICKKCEVKRG